MQNLQGIKFLIRYVYVAVAVRNQRLGHLKLLFLNNVVEWLLNLLYTKL